MTTPQPRTVIAAREEAGRFILTLDGGQEVETQDDATADAAWQSKKDGRQITVELETPQGGGRSRLLELTVLPKGGAAASTAVATRPAQSQSVARQTSLPQGLIMDPADLSKQLQEMAARFNVLTPAIAVSNMAPGFGANLAIVQIDPSVEIGEDGNGTGPDTYFSKSVHKVQTKRSLNKSGLQKIAQALGIQWDHNACRRLDDGKERNFWLWKYVGYVRTHDGQFQTVEGTRELDLRDGAAEAAEMRSSSQLQKQRAMGNQMCETKAMQRAIRTFVRQVYTVDELRKPFLIVRFSFTPDMSDPEIKKLVTQNAMSGIGALYQGAPAHALPALPPAPDDIDEALASAPAEPKPVKEVGHAHTPGASRFTEDAAPAETDEIPIGQTTIEKVEKRQGANKQGPWMLYVVTLGTGEVASTFSKTMQETIDEALKQKAFVKYTTTENPGYDDKLATLELVDKRQQALPMGKEPKY